MCVILGAWYGPTLVASPGTRPIASKAQLVDQQQRLVAPAQDQPMAVGPDAAEAQAHVLRRRSARVVTAWWAPRLGGRWAGCGGGLLVDDGAPVDHKMW